MNFPFDPASPPVCDICKAAPATIQFVEQKGTATNKISLCPNCAAKQGISQDGTSLTFNLASILSTMSGATQNQNEPERICAHCGMTSADFRQVGRLGCSECYDAFKDAIEPLVKRVQAGTAHRGLAPARLASGLQDSELDTLKRRLQEVVKAEKYEDAARLRDRIRELAAKKTE